MLMIATALSAGLWGRGLWLARHDCSLMGSVLFSGCLLLWGLR